MRLKRKWPRRHSWADWRLAMEAIWWLGILRMALCFLPFKYILRRMGLNMASGNAPQGYSDWNGAKAAQISWAVSAAAARVPWRSTCLIQALAGARMLRRRSIHATLHLGTARNPTNKSKLEAHAWLRCGDTILIGRHDRERFCELAAFTTQ